MQRTWRWLVVGLVAASGVALVQAWAQVAEPQPLPPAANTSAAAMQVVTDANGASQAVVYDPQLRSLAVYHIDRATGHIALRSVRRIEWDLQLTDFNTTEPLPQDIRQGLQQR